MSRQLYQQQLYQQQLQQQYHQKQQLYDSSSSSQPDWRCTGKYSLGESQSSSSPLSITENELLTKYANLNMDLKEINTLFKDLEKKKTQKNNNLKKLSKKKTKNSTQSKRINREKQFKDEEHKFAKNIKKILSEKLRDKALQRLARLIKKPKNGRLDKVACAISALLEVLKSCNISTSYEHLIQKYREKVAKDYPTGIDNAIGFLNDILEKKDISLQDFISKQKDHNKKLGEILQTTIKELPLCSA